MQHLLFLCWFQCRMIKMRIREKKSRVSNDHRPSRLHDLASMVDLRIMVSDFRIMVISYSDQRRKCIFLAMLHLRPLWHISHEYGTSVQKGLFLFMLILIAISRWEWLILSTIFAWDRYFIHNNAVDHGQPLVDFSLKTRLVNCGHDHGH